MPQSNFRQIRVTMRIVTPKFKTYVPGYLERRAETFVAKATFLMSGEYHISPMNVHVCVIPVLATSSTRPVEVDIEVRNARAMRSQDDILAKVAELLTKLFPSHDQFLWIEQTVEEKGMTVTVENELRD